MFNFEKRPNSCFSSFLVKKAYYKLSLKVHPDRVEEQKKENATEKFQTLGKVYSILSDQEKRKVYDETGILKPIFSKTFM